MQSNIIVLVVTSAIFGTAVWYYSVTKTCFGKIKCHEQLLMTNELTYEIGEMIEVYLPETDLLHGFFAEISGINKDGTYDIRSPIDGKSHHILHSNIIGRGEIDFDTPAECVGPFDVVECTVLTPVLGRAEYNVRIMRVNQTSKETLHEYRIMPLEKIRLFIPDELVHSSALYGNNNEVANGDLAIGSRVELFYSHEPLRRHAVIINIETEEISGKKIYTVIDGTKILRKDDTYVHPYTVYKRDTAALCILESDEHVLCMILSHVLEGKDLTYTVKIQRQIDAEKTLPWTRVYRRLD